MRLLRQPHEPRCDVYSLFTPYLDRPAQRGLAGLPVPVRRLSPRREPMVSASQQRSPRRSRPRRLRVLRAALGGRPRRLCRRWWHPRCAAGPAGSRHRPGHGRAAGSASWGCSRTVTPWAPSARSRWAASQVTTFRRDHTYRDHRRPDAVTWTDDLVEDLGRRDFTINAIALGTARRLRGSRSEAPRPGRPDGRRRGPRRARPARRGRPRRRGSTEDALRLLRGARFAATLGLPSSHAPWPRCAPTVPTRAGCRANASGRSCDACSREGRPSAALRILDDIGVLARGAARAHRAARRAPGQDPGSRPVRPQHGHRRTRRPRCRTRRSG